MEGCFLCQLCLNHSLFKTAEQLQKHMSTVHKSVLQYCEKVAEVKCDQCSAVYGFKADLEFHKIYWHKSYPATCQLCPKVFQSRKDMAQHIKAAHDECLNNKMEPFCRPCSYLFEVRQDLNRHNLIISYDQGYRWTYCNPFYIPHRTLEGDSDVEDGDVEIEYETDSD